MTISQIANLSAYSMPQSAQEIASPNDINTFIGELMSHYEDIILVPVENFAPEFFDLKSGLTGELMQKCVNYNLRVAIVGAIPETYANSEALKALITESNRSKRVLFAKDTKQLEQLLG